MTKDDSMSDFDPDWPHGHTTRDGRKARIICKDAKNEDFPIVALVTSHAGIEHGYAFTPRGKVTFGGTDCATDLINAPAPKRVVYVNVYDDSLPEVAERRVWPTREKADEAAWQVSRVGCNRVELEPGRWDE